MDRHFVSLILSFSFFLFPAHFAPAGHLPVLASCQISCVVEDSAEWGINTKSANMEEAEPGRENPDETKSVILYTNSDVEIIAAGAGAAALSNGGNPLSLRYVLYCGRTATQAAGREVMVWNDCEFVSDGVYVPVNGAAEVILSISAAKNSTDCDKSANCSDLQTLTVCWK